MSPEELMAAAVEAAERAYAPYSGFRVGAAILTSRGTVHLGGNVENASYGLSVCAERVAAFAMAAADPSDRTVTRVAVASSDAAPCYPCGACRQVLHEFGCQEVWVQDGTSVRRHALSALLPYAFGAEDLGP